MLGADTHSSSTPSSIMLLTYTESTGLLSPTTSASIVLHQDPLHHFSSTDLDPAARLAEPPTARMAVHSNVHPGLRTWSITATWLRVHRNHTPCHVPSFLTIAGQCGDEYNMSFHMAGRYQTQQQHLTSMHFSSDLDTTNIVVQLFSAVKLQPHMLCTVGQITPAFRCQ